MTRSLDGTASGSLRDTTAEARRVQVDCYRRMAPWQKVELCMQLEHLADTLALAGIAERHPQADDDERRLRLLTLKHGPELVRRAYGWSADS